MNDNQKIDDEKEQTALGRKVHAKAVRKLHAQRNPTPGIWSGLGMMGLIGWSVVVPTLLGTALGIRLDQRYPGSRSWTLALLVAGLAVGCLNAWKWVANEEHAIHDEQEHGDE